MTVTFSFALLTSGRSRVDSLGLVGVTGEGDNRDEVFDEVVEDGVVGLPADFATGGGAAGDFRDRNGETVVEALWERLYPAVDIDGEGRRCEVQEGRLGLEKSNEAEVTCRPWKCRLWRVLHHSTCCSSLQNEAPIFNLGQRRSFEIKKKKKKGFFFVRNFNFLSAKCQNSDRYSVGCTYGVILFLYIVSHLLVLLERGVRCDVLP